MIEYITFTCIHRTTKNHCHLWIEEVLLEGRKPIFVPSAKAPQEARADLRRETRWWSSSASSLAWESPGTSRSSPLPCRIASTRMCSLSLTHSTCARFVACKLLKVHFPALILRNGPAGFSDWLCSGCLGLCHLCVQEERLQSDVRPGPISPQQHKIPLHTNVRWAFSLLSIQLSRCQAKQTGLQHRLLAASWRNQRAVRQPGR